LDARAIQQFVELEDRHFWFVGRRAIFLTLLDERLGGRADLDIYDVGCGAGGFLGPLARFGQVTGFDDSAELVDYCHTRGFAATVLAGALALPVPDASADLVTYFDVIEHIPDDVAALAEAARVLRPGGLVFLSTPAYQFLYANNDRVAHHQRRYTAGLLDRRIRAAGLLPRRISYFNTLLFPAIAPAVLVAKALEAVSPPGDRTNLSLALPGWLNRGLGAVMSAERHWLTRLDLPVGHSLIALAAKP
jgi:SAM-dependent methyltransferase